MEKDDKGSTLIRIGVSGWGFLLVPAYPGCPGSKAVKRSLLLFHIGILNCITVVRCPDNWIRIQDISQKNSPQLTVNKNSVSVITLQQRKWLTVEDARCGCGLGRLWWSDDGPCLDDWPVRGSGCFQESSAAHAPHSQTSCCHISRLM